MMYRNFGGGTQFPHIHTRKGARHFNLFPYKTSERRSEVE